MLTRCPACQTVFRLGAAELARRGGEVRCGYCFHPFNALSHEVHLPPAPPPAPAAPATASGPATEPGAQAAQRLPEVVRSGRLAPPPGAADRFADKLAFAYDRERALGLDGLPAAGAIDPTDNDDDDEGDSGAEDAIDAISDAAPDTGDDRPLAAATVEAGTAAARPADRSARPPAHVVITDYAELDARYGRPPAQRSTLGKRAASAAIVLLALAFAAQLAYLNRGELARVAPALRPLLEDACSRLGCEVPWPQQARLISLETSDLHSVPGKPGQYVLEVTISNRADFAQAWPHLELTLTDTRDQALVRRVLSPQQWLPAAESRQDALAGYRSISARIPFAAPELAPTGYRVYVFYP